MLNVKSILYFFIFVLSLDGNNTFLESSYKRRAELGAFVIVFVWLGVSIYMYANQIICSSRLTKKTSHSGLLIKTAFVFLICTSIVVLSIDCLVPLMAYKSMK